MSNQESAMTGAELRSIRELLGLSPVWLSRHLKISEREYVLMERGRSPIPGGDEDKPDVVAIVEGLADEASELVEKLVEQYEREPGGVLYTYETDSDYEYVQQRQKLALEHQKPVRWHHHICARVRDEVDVRIDYVAQSSLFKTTA